MINDGVNNVPDKTIAVFPYESSNIGYSTTEELIKKSTKKRDWFTPHFYRCLPLTIGNQYGFTVCSQFDFAVEWDGNNDVDSVRVFTFLDESETDKLYPRIETHFGHGILTINPPFTLRTPPGVNLMTINPPNHILPNITVMTGVIETDNLRRNFTFNLKIQMPGIRTHFPAGTPLAGFIPIPRYYADSFEIKNAEEIFDEETFIEEQQATADIGIFRKEIEFNQKNRVGKLYMRGIDVYGNKFPDHQGP
jgi:hypothetical protein